MISAIIHGKKRGTGIVGRIDFDAVNGTEDILTATFFERLGYLPDDVFRQFMQNLLGEDVGALEEILFWQWRKTTETGWVEPDVILHCQKHTIIVEAKRWDSVQQQYAEQLAREIWVSQDKSDKPIILLTIGGMANYNQANIVRLKDKIDIEITKLDKLGQPIKRDYHLICKSWYGLYQTLKLTINPYNLAQQRLLDDIANTYDWHGIRHEPMKWLKDMKPHPVNLNQADEFFKKTQISKLVGFGDLQSVTITNTSAVQFFNKGVY